MNEPVTLREIVAFILGCGVDELKNFREQEEGSVSVIVPDGRKYIFTRETLEQEALRLSLERINARTRALVDELRQMGVEASASVTLEVPVTPPLAEGSPVKGMAPSPKKANRSASPEPERMDPRPVPPGIEKVVNQGKTAPKKAPSRPKKSGK